MLTFRGDNRLGGSMFGGSSGGRGCLGSSRLIIALVVAAGALFTYYSSTEENAVTGEKQHVGGVTVQQEIAMGLQAAPQMLQQYGGEAPDPALQQRIDAIGNRIVERSAAKETPYRYEFHVLDDPNTINAFALPGGQVFITTGLLAHLKTEGQIAGVLGHEIGHVVARHGAEQIAKAQLSQSLTGAAVLATYDPNNPSSMRTAAVAQMLAQLVQLRYGRGDELESDRLGVRFMAEAGYDPRAMTGVQEILRDASQGGRPPEFFSTHPNPERRIEEIEQAIQERYPNGVPPGLDK